MSLFGNILSRIFPGNHPAVAANAPTNPPAAQPSAGASALPTAAQPAATAPAASAQPVDVAQILEQKAQARGEKLNWRTSIVDLMKLLDLDSSLGARKQLAQELHYTGDTNDSAAMNVWLHRQVMTKLAENGGKVPQDLRH